MDAANVTLLDILKAADGAMSLASLSRQLLYQVGIRIERSITKALEGEAQPVGSMKVKVFTMMRLLNQRRALLNELLKHVSCGFTTFQEQHTTMYSHAHDEVNVGRCTVSNILWTLPQNEAIIGCPNVSLFCNAWGQFN